MYDRLGPHPSAAEVRSFVAGVLNSTTFGYYPVKLPGDITKSFVNSKNDTMIIALGFGTKAKQEIKDNIAAVRSLLSEGRHQAGVRTYVTGNDAVGIEMEEQAFKDVEKIDPVTVIIVVVLVGLFFLSLMAPFFPFIGIGVALLASQSLLWLIGIFVAKIYYATNILLFVILLGTGMDYSIFILARYREERKGGRSKEESIHTSVQWAGESIATSGVAVMIGFGSMVIGDFAMIQTMASHWRWP
jgi:RND superfamily putative drug exporter